MTEPTADKVRIAVRHDAPAIMELCRTLHDENGMFPLSETKVEAILERAFLKQGGIIGVIGEIGEPLKGVVCMVLDQPYYSDTWFIGELFNFVHPDARKSKCAEMLIEFGKKCSDEMRLVLMMGIISSHRTQAKVRLYERLLEYVGGFFVHNRKYALEP